MNYIADQQGIIDRYLKEAESWNSHLESTKNEIINGAEGKGGESCAILGSGWLLDVPLEFLCSRFKKVYLFDVVHPTQIKHKMRKFPNVVLVEKDITGGAINEFFESVQMFKSMRKRKELSEFKFNGFSYTKPFDYVVSVNILNQLNILLVDYIKPYNLYSSEELLWLSKSIQQKHFDSLPARKACLVTDSQEYISDKDGHLCTTNELIHIELPQDKICASWQWQFDRQDYVPGKNVAFNVVALKL
jgi:hypothetical protein